MITSAFEEHAAHLLNERLTVRATNAGRRTKQIERFAEFKKKQIRRRSTM